MIMGYVAPQHIMTNNYFAVLHINITICNSTGSNPSVCPIISYNAWLHTRSYAYHRSFHLWLMSLFHLECIVYSAVKENMRNHKVENKLLCSNKIVEQIPDYMFKQSMLLLEWIKATKCNNQPEVRCLQCSHD